MIDIINTLIILYGLGVYFFYVASVKTRNIMIKTVKENRYFDLEGKELTKDQFYYNNQIIETGAVILWVNGDKEYRRHHLAHRLDGPAIECSGGTKQWFKNGRLSRLDGPALVFSDGRVEYWIDGVRFSEEQFKLLHDIMKLKGLL